MNEVREERVFRNELSRMKEMAGNYDTLLACDYSRPQICIYTTPFLVGKINEGIIILLFLLRKYVKFILCLYGIIK